MNRMLRIGFMCLLLAGASRTFGQASPGVSDGKLVFTHGDRRQIWVLDADGQRLLATMPSYVVTPRWSPDGTRIAFQSGTQLWVMNADGSNLHVVPGPSVADGGLTWNPSGDGFIYSTVSVCNEYLRSVNENGTNDQFFFDPPSGVAFHADARPGDTSAMPLIVYELSQCGQENLPNQFFGTFLTRSGGSEFQAIPASPGVTRQWAARWSDDGNQLITKVRRVDGTWALETLHPFDASVPRVQHTVGSGGFFGMDFGCNARSAYYARETDNGRNIFRVDFDTNAVSQVTNFTSGANSELDFFCSGPPDQDRDGVPDSTDNCPAVANADQADVDHDGVGDVCEPNVPPQALAGEDVRKECTHPGNHDVPLNGSGADENPADTLTFEWKNSSGSVIGTTPSIVASLPRGVHMLTLTVRDGHGGEATDTVTVTIEDTTPPNLSLSTSSIVVLLPSATASGASVSLAGVASASDACDPEVEITHNAPALFPVGSTIVTFTATDDCGLSSQKQLAVRVGYNFLGFFNPVRNDGSSVFKSGRTVPIKFSLTAADGSVVSNATASIQVFRVLDIATGTVEEVTPDAAGQSNTDNLFRFDAASGQYIYNLKLTGYPAGTYRVSAIVSDGSQHEVVFSVRN